MLESITWPVAFTIVASFTVVVGSIATLAQHLFSRKTDPVLTKIQNDLQELKTDMTLINAQVTDIRNDDAKLDKRVNVVSQDTHDIFNKLEHKIEKISDLIIELIRTQHE